MSRLIEDLLSYSRVGKPSLSPVDLGEVLAKCKGSLKASIEKSQAVITSDRLPRVKGDPTLMGMLLQNLLSNAIKYRSQERPRIHVGAVRDNGVWEVSVSDNGIGIESRHFERIFELFQRLHPQEQYEGSGMGLAICKKIVEIHGGTIEVSSTVGQGTRFSFALPAVGA